MLKIKNKVIELVNSYGGSIASIESSYFIAPNIPSKKLNNAIASYARQLKPQDVIALYDNTLFGKADVGFLIAKKGIWYRNLFEKPNFFLYDQLNYTFVDKSILGDTLQIDFDFDFSYQEKLSELCDDTDDISQFLDLSKLQLEQTRELISNFGKIKKLDGVKASKMESFLNEIMDFIHLLKASQSSISTDNVADLNNNESIKPNYQNKEKLSSNNIIFQDDIKSNSNSNIIESENSFSNAFLASQLEKSTQFTHYHNTKTGVGFAAEDGNALHDTLTFKDVVKTGWTNEKNGSDRIVNGQQIQVKYYNNAAATLKSAFDKNGNFRYDGQLLEVPSDQYEAVVNILQKKIDQGELLNQDGQSIPVNKAEEIVKKGHYTYKQAKNITKAGNVDSLLFDVKNQIISCTCVFGASVILDTAINMWHGDQDLPSAIKTAICHSLESVWSSMLVGVLTSQVLRTQSARMGTILVRPVVRIIYKTSMGKVFIEKLAAATLGKSVYGASATNFASKLLRSNIITAAITGAVLTAPDFYRSFFENSQSWAQFLKNLSVTAGGLAGGGAGWVAGAMVGATIGGPVGATIGGVIGAIGGGIGSSVVSKKLADKIADDDSVEILKDISEASEKLAFDFLLTEAEINDEFIPHLARISTQEFFRLIFQKGQTSFTRQLFIYNHLSSFCETLLEERKHISIPDETFEQVFVDVIEDLSHQTD
jgi:hypothetical protein